MAQTIKLRTPLKDSDLVSLKSGDKVLITGELLTGRDAAHKRLYDLVKEGKPLPVDVKGQVIYYVGPSPAKPGAVIGSANGRRGRSSPLPTGGAHV